ncbi:hypothetical protein VC83_07065 [Pseudogymnoascus destructans]|uniref:Aminoglycoside phosphotransferase domain-containing protein n=2 Tax=Pseudogymnoascus destructans TaxID=655981 RepID=L8FVX5_PSED2|nr:uncharacterized protein VC83_07065 [Pseudogymnoascus destructans]ELR03926.1 hypothetical protein GMDG_06457 [Pseudogymnoascus destructans 20631-21]OAF56739.1 hypothetical protein VC83_07065 [Pseudogymnoascus destructans]
MIVAIVLCQAYHYMIAGGLLYGYVASGDCMVFLAIQGTPGVLYFHFVPSSMDIEGQQPTADITRSTPATQLTTLVPLVLEAETQPLQWVKALRDLRRWPSAKNIIDSQSQGIGGPSLPPPPPPPNDDDEQEGGPRPRKIAKRTREGSPPKGNRLHSTSSTLVAKGVQAVYADALVREACIYSHCKNLQGIYIPVHLGNIDLVVSYPLQSLAYIKHMMLMSWAGTTLEAYIPDGIDIGNEIDRTVGKLNSAGICNGDVRDTNLVWNEEVKGVMAIDFDLAYIYTAVKRSYESASDE